MKRILITGGDSYIGMSFEKWVKQWPDEYSVDTVDMRDGTWREKDFSGFDVVFHVAGIAHVKETRKNKDLYYRVNRDLAFATAKKAKEDGVRQFVFLSSMSVYGLDTGVITKDTIPNPKTNYGKSKLEAENLISNLKNKEFKITILRPPMVYGKNCKGNYNSLVRFSLFTPIIPKYNNQRSMIFIDNLSNFIKILIDLLYTGVFFPQNQEYVCTKEIISLIKETHKQKILYSSVLNILLIIGIKVLKVFKKVFGSLTYDYSMIGSPECFNKLCCNYLTCSFIESINKTES
jgi:nucleoside-diphosphate-sugar epimerase